MAPQPGRRLFLERGSFRRRRMRDAGRMLPIAMLLLMLLPLLKDGEARLSGVLIYLFVLWGAVILCAALLSRLMRDPEPETDPDDPDPKGPGP